MNAKETAIQRDLDGRCVICDESHLRRTRGLCTKHYEQYRRKRDSLTVDAANAWEIVLIETGKLLPNRQGNKSIDDAFADDFSSFVSQNPDALKVQDPPPPTAKQAKTLVDKTFSKTKKKPG